MEIRIAPQEDIDRLYNWMKFNDKLCEMNPNDPIEWLDFLKEYAENKRFIPILKHILDDDSKFCWIMYWDYYDAFIRDNYATIIVGYEILVNCDYDSIKGGNNE